MAAITAVVLTCNEEKNIRDCLASVSWMDAIVVVDSGSTDRTLEICREFTDKIFSRELDGFGPQRNFGMDNVEMELVFSIDSDELVDEALKQ